MKTVVIDFETYYCSAKRGSSKYTLKQQTIEEYVNHERFEVLGCGLKLDDAETEFVCGDAVGPKLAEIAWSDKILIAHNMIFDGSILAWRYKQPAPRLYVDTLSLARLLDGVVGGTKHSLAACSERYELGEKGTELLNTDGKRLEDFDEESLSSLGKYCINDVDLTYGLFKCYMDVLNG